MNDLYEKINTAIEKYYDDNENFDMEQYFDYITNAAKEIYKDEKVYIYDYDTGNDTYELDRQLDDILSLAKQEQIIDFCNCWDSLDGGVIITVIITKGGNR